MNVRLDIIKCHSSKAVKEELSAALNGYEGLLPASTDALILLKPNLNSNMNALTGNTTDLRILSAVIGFLKGRGYSRIVIGEGTNSGFYRSKIGVINRLKIDKLAEYYGVMIKDLNYAEPYEIEFAGGIKAQVAKICVEADMFINLPKLKTHFEIGMSVCLKNLMGTLIGQENKKKTHDNLPENILLINQNVKPTLHIVDALVAMEGLGPTKGTPLRMDTILVGTDPYLIDLACAELAGFDYRKIKTLALAEKKGLLSTSYRPYLDSLNISAFAKKFAPPKAGLLASFIHSPKRQKFFLRIRNRKLFTYLASTDWFGKLLFLTNLRQDVFLEQEMVCEGLCLEENLCDQCGICRDVCPLGFDVPNDLKQADNGCLQCLYCYCVCPQNAIKFSGEFGFYKEQLKQYDQMIRKLYQ